MKNMTIFKILMCVLVVLGINTQATSPSLKSFMPEKKGFLTYTVDEFIDYWSKKSDDTLVYYIGGAFVWSAQNTKASPTESVFDKICQTIPGTNQSYRWIFADADVIRAWMTQLQKDVAPLTGEVRTSGIHKVTGLVERFSRPARDNDIPFKFDWNVVEQMPFTPQIILDSDVTPINLFLSGCGNPYYAPSVGGGYSFGPPIVYDNKWTNASADQRRYPGGISTQGKEYSESSTSGDTYVTNNYYYDQDGVRQSYGQGDDYYQDPVQFVFSLSIGFGGGPLYANTHCGGHGGFGYGYSGHYPGQCSHGYGYQQYGYQPSGGGAPQVTNINIVNEIYNSNVNTNNNTNVATNTNTNNPGHGYVHDGQVPGPHNPIGDPLDPPPRTNPNHKQVKGGGNSGRDVLANYNLQDKPNMNPRSDINQPPARPNAYSNQSAETATYQTPGRPKGNQYDNSYQSNPRTQVKNNPPKNESYQTPGRPMNNQVKNNQPRSVQQPASRPQQNYGNQKPQMAYGNSSGRQSYGGGQSRPSGGNTRTRSSR